YPPWPDLPSLPVELGAARNPGIRRGLDQVGPRLHAQRVVLAEPGGVALPGGVDLVPRELAMAADRGHERRPRRTGARRLTECRQRGRPRLVRGRGLLEVVRDLAEPRQVRLRRVEVGEG